MIKEALIAGNYRVGRLDTNYNNYCKSIIAYIKQAEVIILNDQTRDFFDKSVNKKPPTHDDGAKVRGPFKYTLI